ncbi:MAG: hypothetical protein COU07_02725 [Candidatus Harrisonbacteria bacterium CG10_big_fil_rev_8_21_14_0_10_40_38]|uniref:Cation-transporting P-type ATPase N-terminal domain-containing protein n=1 Tax=Candidatus Harrisonbacteria bacterium CG10_big_fil_rev_8_21_14_0_10_40_38 TaxID=1974583 RepID=A0A2H0URT1_9BACT|nr:MAG: hypothetical protein COU07_02725 [Candidatus Harrisonbacteria bacterium CG10_big_fil_rev_8_21_14_0_10_40_38]
MTAAPWYATEKEDVLKTLHSSKNGLADEEAKERLQKYGPNRLPDAKQKSLFLIFLEQFKSPLIYVLIGADILVFFLNEYTDGILIFFILLFNAILGTVQEGRAQNTLAALSKFTETRAEVVRGGKETDVSDIDIVPGDIITLQEGGKVPADARLLEVRNLTIDEAALTGESRPVRKKESIISGKNLSTTDQTNMVFKGTVIATGTAKAVVVATGLSTVIGGISSRIAVVNTDIPLAKNLTHIARVVVYIVLGLTVGIFALGVLEGRDVAEMFAASVAISVAAVPEGLPLVLTITLAAGVWRMAKRRVLVKKLQAVEALGQAHKIAVDKTGTITKNELVVERVFVNGNDNEVNGNGYEPLPLIENPSKDLLIAGEVAAFCSNAHVVTVQKSEYKLIGDPTEGSLSVFASKVGVSKNDKDYELVEDWPFDYERKFHLAIYKKNDSRRFAITGAPEVILEMSDRYLKNGEELQMKESSREHFSQTFIRFSELGYRVIAFAYEVNPPESVSVDSLPPLIFGGLFAIRDSLRPNISESIEKARNLGIDTLMITGDHAVTAKTIAEQAGIYKPGDNVMTGAELDSMSVEQLAEKLDNTTVFARVTPDHKMRIIEAYRARGEVIAMTGDGVNDAPPLVAADLGIAMGKIGTEVAKEAADIVLLDDNFSDILSAVEEGRNMRQGLRRAITYLFSSNIGEILLIIISLLLGYPIPLLAAQLIWLNVVTDTFFDISLALEPKDPSLMKKGFKFSKQLFDKTIGYRLVFIGPIIAAEAFWLFEKQTHDEVLARTFALTAIVVAQWFNALNCRSETKSVFSMNPFSNKFLTMTMLGVITLHVFAVNNPFFNSVLKIKPLSWEQWVQIISVGSIVLFAEEIRKIFLRQRIKTV